MPTASVLAASAAADNYYRLFPIGYKTITNSYNLVQLLKISF